jgi:hypothetical protein
MTYSAFFFSYSPFLLRGCVLYCPSQVWGGALKYNLNIFISISPNWLVRAPSTLCSCVCCKQHTAPYLSARVCAASSTQPLNSLPKTLHTALLLCVCVCVCDCVYCYSTTVLLPQYYCTTVPLLQCYSTTVLPLQYYCTTVPLLQCYSTTVLLLLRYYCTAVPLLQYCTVVLQYYSTTTTVLLYYCPTTIVLQYYSTTTTSVLLYCCITTTVLQYYSATTTTVPLYYCTTATVLHYYYSTTVLLFHCVFPLSQPLCVLFSVQCTLRASISRCPVLLTVPSQSAPFHSVFTCVYFC